LRRTKSGDYSVENAWNLEQLIAEIKRHKEIIK
jgi:tRNA pseudouridine55 synthase